MKREKQLKTHTSAHSSNENSGNSVETKDYFMEPTPVSTTMYDDNYCMLAISPCLSLNQSEHPSDLIDVEYFEALRKLQSPNLTISCSQDNLSLNVIEQTRVSNLGTKPEKEHRLVDSLQKSSIYRLQLRFQNSQLSIASSYQSSDFTNLRPFPEINTSFDERLLESENKENENHEIDDKKSILALNEHLSFQAHHQQQLENCFAVPIFGKSDLLEAIQIKRQYFIQNSRSADHKRENNNNNNMKQATSNITSTAIRLAPTDHCKRQKTLPARTLGDARNLNANTCNDDCLESQSSTVSNAIVSGRGMFADG